LLPLPVSSVVGATRLGGSGSSFLFLAAPAPAPAPTKEGEKNVTCKRLNVLKNLLIDWQIFIWKTTGTGDYCMHFDVLGLDFEVIVRAKLL